jgi:phosphoglycerate transport regulatory protein PgtC
MRVKPVAPRFLPAVLAVVLSVGAAFGTRSAAAQELESRLVIVTSFSKDLTTPFAQAFEKKHPGTKVEVQNRNSAAAIAFIREARSSPPDIFWASAPDAFEVLKKNALLQKYQPEA